MYEKKRSEPFRTVVRGSSSAENLWTRDACDVIPNVTRLYTVAHASLSVDARSSRERKRVRAPAVRSTIVVVTGTDHEILFRKSGGRAEVVV